jgi:hypothetical protein
MLALADRGASSLKVAVASVLSRMAAVSALVLHWATQSKTSDSFGLRPRASNGLGLEKSGVFRLLKPGGDPAGRREA